MLLVYFPKSSFILFMVRCFFLLIHFLVVEDYELPKSTSRILSASLNLECVRILFWSTSFSSYFNCLSGDVVRKIAIWTDDNAVNSSCDKPSDLLQQVVIWSKKQENAIPEVSGNAILHPIDICEIILYLQVNP